MKSPLPFQQVDVFTDTPFRGNPVAVVLEADDLSTDEMQSIAHWTNLSETTFVCRPENHAADYKLRIFTPKSELPFAGHPTLGSAYAVLKHGITPKTEGRLVQESKIGLIDIEIINDKIFFTLPEAETTAMQDDTLTRLSSSFGMDMSEIKNAAVIDIGAVWMTLQLTNDASVKSLKPDMQLLSSIIPEGVTGVTVFGETSGDADSRFEVRSFAPNEGVPEDPVCGSGNGCVANMVQSQHLTSGNNYTASQGKCIGRDGYIYVRFKSNGKIQLGGDAVTCVDGRLNI